MTEATLYGGPRSSTAQPRRVRTHHLREAKQRGERWPMLTAYEQYSAEIFDAAGVPVLLVGDSAANNVYGYESTLRVSVDELLPLARAVVRATRRALVVADLPFGSYETGPEQAVATAVRFMKEAGAHAVKLEGGRAVAAACAGPISYDPNGRSATTSARRVARTTARASGSSSSTDTRSVDS